MTGDGKAASQRSTSIAKVRKVTDQKVVQKEANGHDVEHRSSDMEEESMVEGMDMVQAWEWVGWDSWAVVYSWVVYSSNDDLTTDTPPGGTSSDGLNVSRTRRIDNDSG